MTMRSPQDIAARIHVIHASDDDLFGFAEEVLMEALDFEHAQQFCDPATTAAQWDQQRWSRHSDTENYARWYLDLPIGKILDHRSGSASRSVTKLAELAWLLGHDDVAAAMAATGYPMYGAPKVSVFAAGLGWPITDLVDDPGDRQMLSRMAKDLQCSPDGCTQGCAD
ncbi:hypothetical protein [Micromonospora endolithica]|uniref:hypothetical protein n=1 Tax=Micromonospora endolithica TaxID=230091 RepID=UPI0011AD4555|nr:hypothetical protein [Micromonospora endolithica]TWJ25120.1 hypothetical protein JD76_05283 [Micromonospora endolithica]